MNGHPSHIQIFVIWNISFIFTCKWTSSIATTTFVYTRQWKKDAEILLNFQIQVCFGVLGVFFCCVFWCVFLGVFLVVVAFCCCCCCCCCCFFCLLLFGLVLPSFLKTYFYCLGVTWWCYLDNCKISLIALLWKGLKKKKKKKLWIDDANCRRVWSVAATLLAKPWLGEKSTRGNAIGN